MTQATLVQEGVERIQDAVRTVEKELGRLGRRAATRRRRLERELAARRRTLERQLQRRYRSLLREVQRLPAVKRAEALQRDVSRQVGTLQKDIERQVEGLLAALRIASRSDVQRLDRKLGQLNKKLRELEKQQGSEAHAA